MQAERIDTLALKQNIDLVELARRYTELRSIASHEYAGACPKCGGEDRFHVRPFGWFCRQCHSLDDHGWSDAIELVQWLDGVDFKEACARLSSGAVMTAPARKAQPAPQAQKRPQQPANWHREAEKLAESASARLWASAGEPGRAYLEQRGLQEHTWLTYRMGYIAQTPTTERAPAIVLPWYRGDQVAAVRFRFLDSPGDVKIKSLAGSQFSGLLYGGQALELTAADLRTGTMAKTRTLVLCEGEINAASIWQVARGTALDVLSLGGEDARLSPAMIAYAQQYGTVLTWLDKPEKANSKAAALSGAHAIASPNGKDANDWLREGLLGGLLATARLRACQTLTERERLLWALYDAAGGIQGIDGGTAQVIERLAGELGKRAPLREAEPGRWITARAA